MQSTDEVSKEKKAVKQRRVVVTGMGVVTSLGHEPDMFYNNLLEGVSGISEIESFDCTDFSTVKFSFIGLIRRLLFISEQYVYAEPNMFRS